MHRSENHVAALRKALDAFESQQDVVQRWGRELADLAHGQGRVLIVGNGGSAAQAQHLSAELVGRYCHDRNPISALALHAETSSVTAIINDFGADALFSRQVHAHGRVGDVLIALSTSGRSTNIVHAAKAAHLKGMDVWALTGPGPNPLLDVATDAVAITADETATIQEVHLIAIHLMCAALDEALGVAS